MPRIVNLEQGSPDWLLWRQAGIGSSEASVLWHGKHFETDILGLWQQKTGLARKEGRENVAMAAGKRYEPELRSWYESIMAVKASPICAVHDEHDWLRASLDGWVAGVKAILEIKYARREYHEDALAGQVPEVYKPQLWHQCLVMGTNRVHYVSYNPRFPAGQTRKLVRYSPTDAELLAMLVILKSFWASVQDQSMPDLQPGSIQKIPS